MTSTIITMDPLAPPTTSLATLQSIPLMKALSLTLDVQPYTRVPWIIVDRNAEED
jgi:hypothetical protein